MVRATKLLSVCMLLAGSAAAGGEPDKVLRRLSFTELQKSGALKSGTVETGADSAGVLRLENATGQARLFPITTIENPGIAAQAFALRGRVRYENVTGTGYLELWTSYPSGARYFSRTLAETGPMQGLSGTSAWREFMLPFNQTGTREQPDRLELNVALPGAGTVYLDGVELIENPAAAAAMSTAQLANIGVMAVCILGVLLALFAYLGRAYKVVVATVVLLVALGAGAIVIGIVQSVRAPAIAPAWALMLSGLALVALPLALLPHIGRRFRELELRRMGAADLAG